MSDLVKWIVVGVAGLGNVVWACEPAVPMAPQPPYTCPLAAASLMQHNTGVVAPYKAASLAAFKGQGAAQLAGQAVRKTTEALGKSVNADTLKAGQGESLKQVGMAQGSAQECLTLSQPALTQSQSLLLQLQTARKDPACEKEVKPVVEKKCAVVSVAERSACETRETAAELEKCWENCTRIADQIDLATQGCAKDLGTLIGNCQKDFSGYSQLKSTDLKSMGGFAQGLGGTIAAGAAVAGAAGVVAAGALAGNLGAKTTTAPVSVGGANPEGSSQRVASMSPQEFAAQSQEGTSRYLSDMLPSEEISGGGGAPVLSAMNYAPPEIRPSDPTATVNPFAENSQLAQDAQRAVAAAVAEEEGGRHTTTTVTQSRALTGSGKDAAGEAESWQVTRGVFPGVFSAELPSDSQVPLLSYSGFTPQVESEGKIQEASVFDVLRFHLAHAARRLALQEHLKKEVRRLPASSSSGH